MAAKRTAVKTVGVISTTVAENAPIAATITNRHSGRAYLTIVTSGEVATASLNLTITGLLGAGASAQTIVSALATPITANGTKVYLIGSQATAAGAVTEVFPFPLPEIITITFTVTGSGASFLVNAALAFC